MKTLVIENLGAENFGGWKPWWLKTIWWNSSGPAIWWNLTFGMTEIRDFLQYRIKIWWKSQNWKPWWLKTLVIENLGGWKPFGGIPKIGIQWFPITKVSQFRVYKIRREAQFRGIKWNPDFRSLWTIRNSESVWQPAAVRAHGAPTVINKGALSLAESIINKGGGYRNELLACLCFSLKKS